jgi:hypothetical protein
MQESVVRSSMFLIFFYRNGKMIVVGSATKGHLILLDIIKIIVIKFPFFCGVVRSEQKY